MRRRSRHTWRRSLYGFLSSRLQKSKVKVKVCKDISVLQIFDQGQKRLLSNKHTYLSEIKLFLPMCMCKNEVIRGDQKHTAPFWRQIREEKEEHERKVADVVTGESRRAEECAGSLSDSDRLSVCVLRLSLYCMCVFQAL